MNDAWIEEYCLGKRGVTKDFQPEWQATRYFVGGKMFAMRGNDKEGRPIFTMKLEPALNDFLRQQWDEIVPGYYMNKIHWSSVYLEGKVPDGVLKDMIDKSYETGIMALPQKIQREIVE